MASPTSNLVLPPEVLVIVFKNLCTLNDIISCKKVCTNWKNVIVAMFKDKGKFLLVSEKAHEIVDLLNPKANYELLTTNIPRVKFATGGLLQKSPIICGGWSNDDCVVIGKPEIEMKIYEKRFNHASVLLDQNTLWLVGGNNENGLLRSTEFIKFGQPPIKGPNLPFRIGSHSMIHYDKKSIYIIGGVQNGSCSNKTWIVDPTNEFLTREGPSLNMKRYKHCCAKMTLNDRTILVVVGGGGRYNNFDSVEILDPTTNNVWTMGPNLPLMQKDITMITSPTGKGVIVMGGETEPNQFSKAIFEMTENLEWIKLKHSLKNDHDGPIALPIPDDMVYEKLQVKNKNKRRKL